MLSVDTWDGSLYDDDSKPTLKESLNKALVINEKVKENIHYKILKVPENCEVEIGQSFEIHYSFKKNCQCSRGWETLSFFVYNYKGKGKNFVKYFKNLKELSEFLSNFEYEIDKDFAYEEISELNKKIEILEKKYEIHKNNFWGEQKIKLFGFATGSYMCKCACCKKEFMGDKRAIVCLDCAIKQAENYFTIVQKYDIIKRALENIVDPTNYLEQFQKDSKFEMRVVSLMITKDPTFYKDIAKKALEKINE